MDRYINQIHANHSCQESGLRLDGDVTYNLNLSMFFRKDGFQEICVLGNIPELGLWKETKNWMKWTEGDIWVLEKPIVTKKQFFTFKFAMCNKAQNKLIQYERGVDRICDLELLPDLKVVQNQRSSDSHIHQHSQTHTHSSYIKYCSLDNLEWESFLVSFSISHPNPNGDESVVLTGNRDEVKNQRLQMIQRPIDWMHSKYGDHTQPWELTVKMPNIEGGVDGVWADDAEHKDFNYTYGIQKLHSSQTIWERAINRQMVLQNAGNYQGQLGIRKNGFWLNTDIVFIVNGRVDMADGNFIGPFHIEKIGDTGIFLGPYPQARQDFDKISEKRVTAVFDIQNKEDHRSLNIDRNQQRHNYFQRGIEVVKHYEVTDDVEAEYCHCLFEAAKILNDLINNQGHKVFVNCTTGVSRGPTLIIVYLALFIQHDCWDDLEKIYDFMQSEYPYQDPNLSVAQILIDTKRDFQQANLKRKQDKTHAAAEKDEKAKKHSGIADEIEKVKKAIKDVENQLLMDQNTHNQKMAKKGEAGADYPKKDQADEIERQRKKNEDEKKRREREIKELKDANDKEYEELKKRVREAQKQRGLGGGDGGGGDSNRIKELLDQIEQGQVKGREKMQDLNREYERKLNEMRMKEQEQSQNSHKLKQNQKDQDTHYHQELTTLQLSLKDATPLEAQYRKERESLEKSIQQFIIDKTDLEEKERKQIIEITQKESEWNLDLLKEQEQLNSKKISILHKSSQQQIHELELESDKRMQQTEHDSNQKIRLQEQEVEFNLKLKYDELEKRRKFQENEERLQKKQFEDYKSYIQGLEVEFERKVKYEDEIRTSEILEQDVAFKKKWIDEMTLKYKTYVEEDERRRKQITLELEERQQQQQEEIDQWREYQMRIDAERRELREKEEQEWMEQMQEEREKRLETKRARIQEAENRRKQAQEKKQTQVTNKFTINQDWDDQEIARMEAAKKLRMVEIQRKKQQYLDSLKSCHNTTDISHSNTNTSRLHNSIHRQRSIEADRFKKVESNRRNQELKDLSMKRTQMEAEMETRRMNLRKSSVSKQQLQSNQSHIMNEVTKLREQQMSGRQTVMNRTSKASSPKNEVQTSIEFEKRHVRQSLQSRNELNSFNARDRKTLAASRQNLLKSQQLSQTRSLLKPPTPVNNKNQELITTPQQTDQQQILNNDLFSSQKKPQKLLEKQSDRYDQSTVNQVIMDESNQNVQELKIDSPSESEDPPLNEDYLQEEEINRLSQELFTTAPIKFKQRRNNQIDTLIQAIILAKGITIPIIWIKDDLYLIGHQRMTCSIKRNCLMLRVGGGYEPFQEYIVHNEGYFMRQLIILIIKSQQTLDEVIQALLKGQKIRNVYQEAQQKGIPIKKLAPSQQPSFDQVQGLPNLRSRQPTIGTVENVDQIQTVQEITNKNFFDVKQESEGDLTDRRHTRQESHRSVEKPSSPFKQSIVVDDRAIPDQQKPSTAFEQESNPKKDEDESNALLQKQLLELQLKYDSLKQETPRAPPANENTMLSEQLQTLQTKYESLNQLYSQSQAIEENREHLKSIEQNLKSFLEKEFQSKQASDQPPVQIPEPSQHTVQKVSVISQDDLRFPQPKDIEHKRTQSMVDQLPSKQDTQLKKATKKPKNESLDEKKAKEYSSVKQNSDADPKKSSSKKEKPRDRESEKDRDNDKQRKKEKQKEKVREVSSQKEKVKEKTKEKEKDKSRAKEKERERDRDRDRSDKDREKDRDKEKIKDKQKELKMMEQIMAEQIKKKLSKQMEKTRKSENKSRESKSDYVEKKIEKRSKRSSNDNDYSKDKSKIVKKKKKDSGSKRYEARYSVHSSSSDDREQRVYYKERSRSSSDDHGRQYIYKKESSSSDSGRHYKVRKYDSSSDGHHHRKKSDSSSDGHHHREIIYRNKSSSSHSDKQSLKSLQKSLSVVLEKSDIVQTSSPNHRNKSRSKSPFGTKQRDFSGFLSTYNVQFKRPLDEIWAEFDTQGEGQLSKDQTQLFLAEVCKVIQGDRAKNYDSANFDKLFEQFDADGNGLMSKMEMAQFIKLAFKNKK